MDHPAVFPKNFSPAQRPRPRRSRIGHTARLDLMEILTSDDVNVTLTHEAVFHATSRIEMPGRHSG